MGGETLAVHLPPDEGPDEWYNVLADLPEPLPPPRDPDPGQPRLKMLQQVLLKEGLRQETATQRWIPIPSEILDLHRPAGRPRPLFRARRLEERLGTPAKMYFKSEFFSPTGSHKVNTALAQAWYAAAAGYERVTTETGAGQWGTALGYAASPVGLKKTGGRVPAGPRRAEDDRVLGPRGPGREGGPAESDAPVRRGGARAPEPEDEDGPRAPEKGQEAPRVARHRGERGARGRARRREGGVLPGVRAEPRAAPPDRDRARDKGAIRADRGVPGRRDLVPRRRLELRRLRPPVPARRVPREVDPVHSRPERRRPEPSGEIRVRLRGPRAPHAAAQDVPPGTPREDAADPRRRAAVPRGGADPLPGPPPRVPRHGRVPRGREARVRARAHVRAGGGVPAC